MSRPQNSFEPDPDFQNNPFGPQKGCVRAFKNLLSKSYLSPLECVLLLFFKFYSILSFDFDLILGSFLTFWGPDELILGPG